MKKAEQFQYERAAAIPMPWGAIQPLNFLFSIWPYRIVRMALSAVFFWSGISKLFDPRSFAVIIEAFGLIPDSWVMPMSICLPAIEVVLAVGLLADIRGSLVGTAGLLAVFMAILGYGIHMGLDVDCGCFGPEDPEAEAFHGLRSALYRDLVMAAGIGYLYLWRFVRSARPIGCAYWTIFLKRRC